MPDPVEARLALAHCDAALEASCDALIVLQVIDALAINLSDDVSDIRNAVSVAIESTSRAISELRRARTVRRNSITVGFVLARDERGAGSNSPQEG